MPKQKTHSGSKKRFKRTASGGYMHKPAGRRHLLTGKSTKRKRHLRGSRPVNPADHYEVKALLVDDNKEQKVEKEGDHV